MDEFKEFIAQGNVMDMAVGIIIGGAFTGIVNALVEDIINPLITTLTGGGTDMAGSLVVAGMDFGAFISAIINFILIALVVFWLIKGINKMRRKSEEAEPEVAAPTCPFCKEEVKEGATRCPHCGEAFEAPAAPEA